MTQEFACSLYLLLLLQDARASKYVFVVFLFGSLGDDCRIILEYTRGSRPDQCTRSGCTPTYNAPPSRIAPTRTRVKDLGTRPVQFLSILTKGTGFNVTRHFTFP